MVQVLHPGVWQCLLLGFWGNVLGSYGGYGGEYSTYVLVGQDEDGGDRSLHERSVGMSIGQESGQTPESERCALRVVLKENTHESTLFCFTGSARTSGQDVQAETGPISMNMVPL